MKAQLIWSVAVVWSLLSVLGTAQVENSGRENCFRRSICGGREDGPVCLNSTTLVTCIAGDEVDPTPCVSCSNGRCLCPQCSLSSSTGQCDPFTGKCKCLPGMFGVGHKICWKQILTEAMSVHGLAQIFLAIDARSNPPARCFQQTQFASRMSTCKARSCGVPWRHRLP